MKPLDLSPDAPWKRRYRAPWIPLTQIARLAPERGLATANLSGIFQLYAWEVASGELRQLTNRPAGLFYGLFAPDGRYVYYLDDKQGNEIGHFVRLPYEGGVEEDVTPDLPLYSSFGMSASSSGNKLGFVGGTADGFRLYVLDVAADGAVGEVRELYHIQPLMFQVALSQGGEVAVVASTEKTGRPEFALVAFDTATGERIGELWDGEQTSIQPILFSPVAGDMRLLATTNRSGTEQLLLWDVLRNERVELTFDEAQGSVNAMDWSLDGRILFRTFNQAVQQFYTYHVETGKLTRLNHPSGTITAPYFGPGGEIFVHLQDSTHPSRLVALDGETGEFVREVLAASEMPPGHGWRSITFPSSDGQPIQGWLALPDGAGPFPTILETHGGPTSVVPEMFTAGSQAWLDHGFAFLTINYRGSTTFGRDFEYKIVGNPGYWELEDMAAARQWLIDNGISEPDQILLTGWSYGGYLTLMGLGRQPALWAGGMAGIAIADWAIQYEDSAEMLRGYQKTLLGGTPAEKPEQYATSSPITYAEQVSQPVLIIQGRNDTRTPARPVAMYEARLKALGKPVEVHWFESGHLGSAANVEQAIEHQEIMMRFAYRVLG